MTAHDNAQEQESVDFLTTMMGDTVSDPSEVARRVLRKCDGDVNKAATAILEGDRGEDRLASPGGKTEVKPYSPPPSGPGKNSPVIDLTADEPNDSDLTRALKASLEPQNCTQFGPSERAPDPNWAVVPSNVPAGSSISQDDQAMDRAIHASLQSDFVEEVIEEKTVEDLLRRDNRPIALRPTKATLAYAALIIQGLFFVPQVRMGIARFRPSVPLGADQDTHEDALWSLAETYTNMEIALLAELDADPCLKAFEAREWTNHVDRPGHLSRAFYKKVTRIVETIFYQQFATSGGSGPRPRLFHFLHGHCDIDSPPALAETDIVVVTIGSNRSGGNNDLMACLSAQLSAPPDLKMQECIFEPSDVVAFDLTGSPLPVSSYGSKIEEFTYPKHIYMDQFLEANIKPTNEKRAQQREMGQEVEKLMSRRKSLMAFNNKDTLKDLRATIYYYDNVADAKEDTGRQADIERTGGKLKRILTTIEKELESIDARITKLKADSATLFDTPDLQKLRYDLRVVFIHDGLFGRKHLHSYVQDRGKWWKTVDNTVTEVSEESVFTDRAGLHLMAGPYLLIYSKALSTEHLSDFDRQPWPGSLKNSAKHNNKQLLSEIKPEVASQVHDFNSPPTSPMNQSESLQPTNALRQTQTQELMDMS